MTERRDIREVLDEAITDMMTLGLSREQAVDELLIGLEEKIRQDKKLRDIDRSS